MFRIGPKTQNEAEKLNEMLAEIRQLREQVDMLRRMRLDVRQVQAKITGVDGNGNYHWIQVDFTPTGVPFEMQNGLFGGPAYGAAKERNGLQVCQFPFYTLLTQRLDTESAGPVWEFDATAQGSGSGSGSGGGSGCCLTSLVGDPANLPGRNPNTLQLVVVNANNCYALLDTQTCVSGSGSGG